MFRVEGDNARLALTRAVTEKYLLALKALNLARKANPDHPDLHERIAHFKHTSEHKLYYYPVWLVTHRRGTVGSVSDLPAHVQSLVTAQLSVLVPNQMSAEAYNTAYLQKHSNSAPAQLAAARVIQTLRGDEGQSEAEALVQQMLRDEFNPDIKVRACV